MKTQTKFYRSPSFIVKRLNTIGSQLSLGKQQTPKQKIRNRLKTMVSMAFESQRYSPVHSALQIKIPGSIQSPRKTPRIADVYDQQNQYLTTQFQSQMQRMQTVKKETYCKLRGKFVKKYPQYRMKYKKSQLEELQPEIQHKFRTQTSLELYSPGMTSIRGSIRKSTPPDPLKSVCFYSRSKRKCMYNTFTQRQITVQSPKQAPIPRMSFMTYIKKYDQRKKFKVNRVKGNNMIETREKILRLEKQGTKSFNSLKKCLQDAIETCIVSK